MFIDTRPHPRQRVGNPTLKRQRALKRMIKAHIYRTVALQGGGKREQARRAQR